MEYRSTMSLLFIIFLSFLGVSLIFSFGPTQDPVPSQINNEPIFSEIKFELEKLISIGDDSRPNYSFYKIRDLAVDAEDCLYVVDLGNFRIQKFDKQGKYLLTIGRQGQGPGDLEFPTQLWIDSSAGLIYVKNHVTNIDVFNLDGQFIRRFKFERPIQDFAYAYDSNNFVIIWKRTGTNMTNSLCQIDLNGNIIRNIIDHPFGKIVARGGSLSVSTGYETTSYVSNLDSENIVYGFSGGYELCIYNTNGNLKRVIRNNVQQPKFTSEEIKSIRKGFVPNQKPYFYDLFVDSEKRIYVQTNLQSPVDGPSYYHKKMCDVFNSEGVYLGRLELPANTKVINKSKLYAFTADEKTGMETVHIYSIRNWDSFNSMMNTALTK